MQHSSSVQIHIRKAKHTQKNTASVLSKALWKLDIKPRRCAKWSKCVQIHTLCTGSKVCSTKKFDLSRMCTIQSHVLQCPWNICRAVPIVSSFVPISLAKRKAKTPAIWHFQCTFRTCVRNSSNQDSHQRKQTVLKLLIMHKKGRFHDTTVQHVQNVCYRTWCYTYHPIQQESEKHGEKKSRFRCDLSLSAQRTSSQDRLLRHPTVSKITHYPHISNFPWTTGTT